MKMDKAALTAFSGQRFSASQRYVRGRNGRRRYIDHAPDQQPLLCCGPVAPCLARPCSPWQMWQFT